MHNLTSPPAEAFSIMQAILTKGGTGPSVTASAVQGAIIAEHYFTAAQGVNGASQPTNTNSIVPLSLLTFCVLTLKNGYTVTGHSACVSAANFSPDIGKGIARQNAEAQIWPLLGYALKEEIYQRESAANCVRGN